MSRKRLAVIPARGGSKRIPDKNIRIFGCQPMIAHILETARNSELFDVIHVTTESPRIASVVNELGFETHFPRPPELADDNTPLMPVLRYVTEAFLQRGQRFDEVWLLMPCAALIETEDLCAGAQLLADTNFSKAVLAVAPYPAPIEWAFDRADNGSLIPLSPGKFAVRSQDLTPKFYDAGAFCAFPAGRVLESRGAGEDTVFVGYILPRHKAIDIDTEDDWQLAEILFAGAMDLAPS